ncbi:unnamed protein product, partial [Iphiclides podalirius]
MISIVSQTPFPDNDTRNRLRRKSDSKKHQSIIQNVKGAAATTSRSTDTDDSSKEEKNVENKESHKKYYHTVTEKKVSSLQEIFRPLEENKVPESVRENDNEVISIEVPNLIVQTVPEADEATSKSNSAADNTSVDATIANDGDLDTDVEDNSNNSNTNVCSHRTERIDVSVDRNNCNVDLQK